MKNVLEAILNGETPEDLKSYLENDITKDIFSIVTDEDQYKIILEMNRLITNKNVNVELELGKIIKKVQDFNNKHKEDDDDSIII